MTPYVLFAFLSMFANGIFAVPFNVDLTDGYDANITFAKPTNGTGYKFVCVRNLSLSSVDRYDCDRPNMNLIEGEDLITLEIYNASSLLNGMYDILYDVNGLERYLSTINVSVKFPYYCGYDSFTPYSEMRYFCTLPYVTTDVTWMVNNSTVFDNSYSLNNLYPVNLSNGKNETVIVLEVKPSVFTNGSIYEYELHWTYKGESYSYNSWKQLVGNYSSVTKKYGDVFAIKCENGKMKMKPFDEKTWYTLDLIDDTYTIFTSSSHYSGMYVCIKENFYNFIELNYIPSIFENIYVISIITVIVSLIVFGVIAYIILIIYRRYYGPIPDPTIVMR